MPRLGSHHYRSTQESESWPRLQSSRNLFDKTKRKNREREKKTLGRIRLASNHPARVSIPATAVSQIALDNRPLKEKRKEKKRALMRNQPILWGFSIPATAVSQIALDNRPLKEKRKEKKRALMRNQPILWGFFCVLWVNEEKSHRRRGQAKMSSAVLLSRTLTSPWGVSTANDSLERKAKVRWTQKKNTNQERVSRSSET